MHYKCVYEHMFLTHVHQNNFLVQITQRKSSVKYKVLYIGITNICITYVRIMEDVTVLLSN